MPGIVSSKRRKAAGRRGAQIVEFTLVLLPLLAFTFLLLDMGWAIFKRATLQYAVREGCRYAVTNQLRTDLTNGTGHAYGMIDSVKAVVQANSMGFLGSAPSGAGWNAIQVRFYAATGNMTTALALPPDCTTAGPNGAVTPNLVEVSVENYQANPLAPLMRSSTPLSLTARSTDRMESIPRSGAPKLLTCP